MKNTNSKDNNFIHKFIPLVGFLGAFLGDNCEVVLHDTSKGRNPSWRSPTVSRSLAAKLMHRLPTWL